MTRTRHIGKESHDWERQAALGLNLDGEISYGRTGAGLEAIQTDTRETDLREVRRAVELDGLRATARRFKMDASNLRRRLNGNNG